MLDLLASFAFLASSNMRWFLRLTPGVLLTQQCIACNPPVTFASESKERAVLLCANFVLCGALHADYLRTAANNQLWLMLDTILAMFALKLLHIVWVKENTFH